MEKAGFGVMINRIVTSMISSCFQCKLKLEESDH
ncbi:hypothetical protein NIES298_18650 [Microcystis aeruginosa NIES-298]|nr:hypothetical protein NIES298_18650 [Microcystis aeruginosa NIES-298]